MVARAKFFSSGVSNIDVASSPRLRTQHGTRICHAVPPVVWPPPRVLHQLLRKLCRAGVTAGIRYAVLDELRLLVSGLPAPYKSISITMERSILVRKDKVAKAASVNELMYFLAHWGTNTRRRTDVLVNGSNRRRTTCLSMLRCSPS